MVGIFTTYWLLLIELVQMKLMFEAEKKTSAQYKEVSIISLCHDPESQHWLGHEWGGWGLSDTITWDVWTCLYPGAGKAQHPKAFITKKMLKITLAQLQHWDSPPSSRRSIVPWTAMPILAACLQELMKRRNSASHFNGKDDIWEE